MRHKKNKALVVLPSVIEGQWQYKLRSLSMLDKDHPTPKSHGEIETM